MMERELDSLFCTVIVEEDSTKKGVDFNPYIKEKAYNEMIYHLAPFEEDPVVTVKKYAWYFFGAGLGTGFLIWAVFTLIVNLFLNWKS